MMGGQGEEKKEMEVREDSTQNSAIKGKETNCQGHLAWV